MHIQTHVAPQRLFKKTTDRQWSLHLEQKGQIEECVLLQNNPPPPFFQVITFFVYSPSLPPQPSPTLISTPTWFIAGRAGSGYGNVPRRWLSQQRATEALLSTLVFGGEMVWVRQPQLPEWMKRKGWEYCRESVCSILKEIWKTKCFVFATLARVAFWVIWTTSKMPNHQG